MNTRVGDLATFRRDVTRRRSAAIFDKAVIAATQRIVADVRRRGDDAVLAHVRRFDHPGARLKDLWIDGAALRSAARPGPPGPRSAPSPTRQPRCTTSTRD